MIKYSLDSTAYDAIEEFDVD